MEIKEISKETYDNYLKQVKINSFLQASQMSNVLETNNCKTEFLALVDDKEILAVAIAIVRKVFLGVRIDLMTGSISTEPKNEYIFYDKLKDYVKQENCLKLVVKPDKNYCMLDQDGNIIQTLDSICFENMNKIGYIVNDGSVTTFDGSPDYQFVKDLSAFFSGKEVDLLKSFNQNAQRKIKKGNDMGIRVRTVKRQELKEFKKLTLETSERQDFSDMSLEYYDAFYDAFSENAEFLTSEIDLDNSIKKLTDLIESCSTSKKNNKQKIESLYKEKEMLEQIKKESKSNVIQLANMIIVYLDEQAIYFLGGSSTKYQKIPGAFMIQFEAMKRALQKNIPSYNFFGVQGNFDGSDGVLRFKKNFNGYIIQKVGAFIYYPHPGKYKIIQFLKQIKNKIKI